MGAFPSLPATRLVGASAELRARLAARSAPARALAAGLLDAFLSQIEPVVARLVPRRRAVIVLEGDALVLHEQVGRQPPVRRGILGEILGGERPPLSAPPTTVDLRLPPDRLLRRTLALPEAGRDYLRPIIAHRLERLTPWRPDRVVHGFAVVPGERADGTIAVDLLATSLDRLAPVLDRLASAGLVPSSLGSAEDPLDAPPRIDLYAGRAGGADPRLRRIVGRAALATVAVLAACAIGSGWLAGASEDARAADAGRLAALRTRLQASRGAPSGDLGLIAAHRAGSSLVLLDGLSAAIPDGTSLREINLTADKIRLVGRSGDAPALIGPLEGRAGLTGVRFAAPVVRDAAGRDLFEIVAERAVKPVGPDGPAATRGAR